jgi:hypothetical protein
MITPQGYHIHLNLSGNLKSPGVHSESSRSGFKTSGGSRASVYPREFKPCTGTGTKLDQDGLYDDFMKAAITDAINSTRKLYTIQGGSSGQVPTGSAGRTTVPKPKVEKRKAPPQGFL